MAGQLSTKDFELSTYLRSPNVTQKKLIEHSNFMPKTLLMTPFELLSQTSITVI